MHRSSQKKLVSKLHICRRTPKTKIELRSKRPRIGELDPSRKSALPKSGHRLKADPTTGAHGQLKAEPRFLSDAALANAEQLFSSIKSQTGEDLSEKIKDLIRRAREQGYLTFDDVHETLP